MAKHIKELFDLTGKTALVTGGSRGIGVAGANFVRLPEPNLFKGISLMTDIGISVRLSAKLWLARTKVTPET